MLNLPEVSSVEEARFTIFEIHSAGSQHGSHVLLVEVGPAFCKGSIDRLSSKIVVEAGHYDAVSINNLDSVLFPVLLQRVALVLYRFMLQDSLSKLMAAALGSDPGLTGDPGTHRVLQDDDRMEMAHHQELAAEQWRRWPGMAVEEADAVPERDPLGCADLNARGCERF